MKKEMQKNSTSKLTGKIGKKAAAVILTAAMCMSLFAGCGQGTKTGETNGAQETAAEEAVREVTDAAGNVVKVPADISKIAVTPLP